MNKLTLYKTYLCLSVILILLFTLTKSIRMPNDWAEAHWLIGYQFGFIKRGLPGEILRMLSVAYPNFLNLIMITSLTAFFLLMSSIVLKCVRFFNLLTLQFI
jgi:hypothetical protein